MMGRFGTSSLRRFPSWLSSLRSKMPSDEQHTMAAQHLDHLIREKPQTRLEHLPSGSMSTQELRNLMHPLLKLRWPFRTSFRKQGYLSRYMLDQVTVFMFIGPSAPYWNPVNGYDMHMDLETLHAFTGFKLMWFGLVISRLYYELPEPTTESTGTPS